MELMVLIKHHSNFILHKIIIYFPAFSLVHFPFGRCPGRWSVTRANIFLMLIVQVKDMQCSHNTHAHRKTHKVKRCTLWKRLCFIEIQQTSTGCFADLGNRNRAWIRFKQRKNKYRWLFLSFRSQKTTKTLSTWCPNWGNAASLWATSW